MRYGGHLRKIPGTTLISLSTYIINRPAMGPRVRRSSAIARIMNKAEKLVLVDGSSYLYRAFHALPRLSNSAGEPTGAVYGVIGMIRRLLTDYAPNYVAIVFDAKGTTFRHRIYPQYKATRPPMPDELRAQVPVLHQVIGAMGLPLLIVDDVEADDVIATLATEAVKLGIEAVVSTGDKDLAQIVNRHVTLVDTMHQVEYDRAAVESKFGVPPERIVDYLALVGDASDNVPGVPNVGPKTAQKWLQRYGSLEAVIKHADEISGKVGVNLRGSLESLPLYRRLVTVKRDVELEVGPKGLRPEPTDEPALKRLYARLEFKSWLADLGGLTEVSQDKGGAWHYDVIIDEAALSAWIERLEKAALFAFDTETTSLDAVSADLVGVSFAVRPGEAAYVPFGHDYPGAPEQLSKETVLTRLRGLLQDAGRAKVGQNLKYDHCVLAGHGIELEGIAFDTMLESYVLNSVSGRHDMDTLALRILGHKTITFEEVAGKGKAQRTFNQIELERAAPYAAEDADVALRLHRSMWPELEAQPKLRDLFKNIEMPLVPVLSRIERNGVKIDADMLARQSRELSARISEIEEQAYRAAGGPFNVASPKQIQEILYQRLRLPVLRRTPKGQPSTAENVLQELAVDYDLPRLILEHRALSKLKSTYTDKLPAMVNPRTGRVHTSYHQAVAATGRLSSADPNLQNIPVRTAEGRRIREAFVPVDGCVLLSADYSQIELRIMAHLSQDPGLLQAFAQGEDIHRATAAEVFGAPADAVTDEQRRHAKAINFGLIYGMSAFGLSRQLGIPRSAAQEYVDLYFARYPGVRRFMDDTRSRARELGYVETVFGRRLYLPEITSSNSARRQYAERTAINAPMQGTAADLIKMAMLALDRWIREKEGKTRMIMQVHDELVFEVPTGRVEKARDVIAELMSGVATLSVPLVVDVGTGANWAQAHA